MGETGTQNFERTMAADLMGFAPIVDRWLKARFPSIYSKAIAFDCHSAGMLDILERGYTGICPQERQHIMFKRSIEHVGEIYQDIKLPERMHEGYYTRGNVDFAKLDPAFINSLPLVRRRIWKMRREGMKVKDIAKVLKLTINNVCAYCYYIRQSYVKWMAAKQKPCITDLEILPDNKYYRYVAQRRYIDGYAISLIAEELGIQPSYVRTIMCRVKAIIGLKET